MRPLAGPLLPPASVAMDRRFAGVRVGPQSAQAYLQELTARMLSATAFAAHEAHDPALWARVLLQLTQLLHAEWRAGRLLGQRQADAFFVRCDRTTMTQADVANGQLVALAGVAIIRPAEFAVFRIEQATGASGRR